MATIYLSLSAQVAKSTFFMKPPIVGYNNLFMYFLSWPEFLFYLLVVPGAESQQTLIFSPNYLDLPREYIKFIVDPNVLLYIGNYLVFLLQFSIKKRNPRKKNNFNVGISKSIFPFFAKLSQSIKNKLRPPLSGNENWSIFRRNMSTQSFCLYSKVLQRNLWHKLSD